MKNWLYLATPYSRFPGGHDAACTAAAQQAGLLLEHGYHVFSPIVHSHPLAVHSTVDKLDHELWLDLDFKFLKYADVLVICKLPGWEYSFGIEQERQWVEHHSTMPVIYMSPNEVPKELENLCSR